MTAGSRGSHWLAPASIAGLALLSTFNALGNGFTYDDRFVVVGNSAIRNIIGWKQFVFLPYWPLQQGGDGYRPLTTFLFATEWAVSRGPALFHAVTIVLYVACCLLVVWFARKLVKPSAAWWAAALFAVHPVHTEVTGGVVGQSELLAAVALLGALGLYVGGRQAGPLTPRRQLSIAFLFFLGCMAKEHVLVLPLLLALAEATVVNDGRGVRARASEMKLLIASVVLFAVAFVALRSLVIPLGIVGFAPFTPFTTLGAGVWDRFVTMLGIAPHWVRLLVWPRRLSTEYGPPAYPVGGEFHLVTIAGILVASILAIIAVRARRSMPLVTFCIAWIAVLLVPVSNILFPTGVLLAERTLFAPSIGACILLGVLVAVLAERAAHSTSLARVASVVLPGAMIVAGASRSIVRLSDWRDNQSLFESGVAAEPDVYRAHYMLGAWYLETGRWPQARVEMTRAVGLFDRDPAVQYNLGIGYFAAGDYRNATRMFQEVDRVMPGALDAKTKIALALAAEGRYAEAQGVAAGALRDSRDPWAMQAVLQAAALSSKSSKGGPR